MESNIKELQDAIKRLHGVDSTHVGTVSVVESFQGQTVWNGEVEVFDIYGHPKAKQAYAWAHETENPNRPRYVTVLSVPPITSPELAVKAVIVYEYKQKEK